MKYILIILVLIIGYYWIKNKTNEDITEPCGSMHSARLMLKIPNDIPVNWWSHHPGVGYVGDAAIVNCEYIISTDWSENRTWKIALNDISRYSIQKNNDNKWAHIIFILNNGSKEILVLKQNEVSLFERAYQEAVKGFYEMKEFLEQEQ